MSNETVEFNSHPLDSVDTIEDSIVDEAVVIVEEERPALTGYELVADMMRRQDDVINELDDLNNRIEAAIQEITDARKIEDEATQNFQHQADEDLLLGKAA